GRTMRHAGYAISQRVRKLVEKIFGWGKTAANFRRTRFKGRAKTQLAAYFVVPPTTCFGLPSWSQTSTRYPSLSRRSRRCGRGRPRAAAAGGEHGRGWASKPERANFENTTVLALNTHFSAACLANFSYCKE